jgi:hypothetical protein
VEDDDKEEENNTDTKNKDTGNGQNSEQSWQRNGAGATDT